MHVHKVFWEQPYLSEITARITSINESVVTLDRTIAYAFSGGQESDAGTIDSYKILKAEKVGKNIYYTIHGSHNLKTGDSVLVKIDWERRYRIMRLHFAAEIILELINQNYNHPEKLGAHISEEKARLDFRWEGSIADTFDLLSKEMESIVERDLEIKSKFIDEENEIRCWEIEGFAEVLCGGTHIKSTGEIGRVALRRNNIGRGKERIEIYLT
ncbi:MAG: Alanyl-tRNA editing protein [Firmicutes bacterium]|nr:Alanyl-tRNA editing protein [Bacillota bacterium]MDI6706047.1 alanyl-tRNA editing protein [Bacillota bacterium]